LNYLKNEEINDISEQEMKEEEYVEAMLVYIKQAKNLVGQYLQKQIITNQSI